MNRERIYFYPMSGRNRTGRGNPYSRNQADALGKHYDILNLGKPTSIGIVDLLRYLRKTDILFLNWIEDLPDKKFGYLQSALFVLLFHYLRLRRKKICWVLHNKFSHYKKNRKLKAFLFKMLAAKSTHILTHSGEGLEYIRLYDPKHDHNILFCHHPLSSRDWHPEGKKKWDIFIWGTLLEYKGVDKFLDYLYAHDLSDKFRILVSGKIFADDYRNKLMKYSGRYIRIEDRFVDEDELLRLMAASKMIVFTYTPESVLSSGALMDSLSAGATIAGPDTGAFRDLGREGLLVTYKDFAELVGKAEKIIHGDIRMEKNHLNRFIRANSWDHFGEKMKGFLEKQPENRNP